MQENHTSKSGDCDPWAVDPDEAAADTNPYRMMSGALSGWETDEDKISSMTVRISVDSKDFDDLEARAREMTLDDLVWDIPPKATTTSQETTHKAVEHLERPSCVTSKPALERHEMAKPAEQHNESDDELCNGDEVGEPVRQKGRLRRKDLMAVPVRRQDEHDDEPSQSQSHQTTKSFEHRDQSPQQSSTNKQSPLDWGPDTEHAKPRAQKRHECKLQGKRRNYLTHPISLLAGETSPEQVQLVPPTLTRHAGSRVRTYSKKIKFRRTRSWHEGEA